jgi:hypothetical protein
MHSSHMESDACKGVASDVGAATFESSVHRGREDLSAFQELVHWVRFNDVVCEGDRGEELQPCGVGLLVEA